ncbi:uncharacterized protein EDB91DRAFT_868582 [Suillus paluster]|uniref:uncharacterized protein n=1 Tax=Suillus paluster TaxID=48578 RepID=UPI001B87D11F|nr:uncharacterized protein EDB91DRAFT_868582 [Suillus paluster]KAG1728062.1 hypothetical protein EDB91DRAFT_868582 [Suillus paluster]
MEVVSTPKPQDGQCFYRSCLESRTTSLCGAPWSLLVTVSYGGCRFGTGDTQQRPLVLADDVNPAFDEAIDFCFLGNDRLLIFSDNTKLYSIEDMSQASQLLACFLLPVSVTRIHGMQSVDGVAHGSRSQMQAQQTIWTSDPNNQILSVVTFSPSLVFIISTRIFFTLDFFEGMTAAIP